MKLCRIYLWGDEVAHSQWESQHEESNSITSKLCSLCFLHKHLQKVSCIFRGNRYCRRVRHNTLKSVGQALEDSCNSLIGYKCMLLAVFVQRNQIWPLQSLGVTVHYGRNNVFTVKSNKPLMKLILWTGSQYIKIKNFHPSVRREKLVSQLCLCCTYLHTA